MNTLYQFPVSHYCEKARWALDHKGIPYRTRNLLPGPHIKQVRKLAPTPEVPVLKLNDDIIHGSDHIIDFLDRNIPGRQLTPQNINDAKLARELEDFASVHIGDPLRCLLYHELLEYPEKLTPALTHQGPWYGKLLYKLIYPQLKQRIREGMKINDATAAQARKTVTQAIDDLGRQMENKAYLVGDTFSRADLSIASMLAPLVWPTNSWFIWTENLPGKLTDFREPFTSTAAFHWVQSRYTNNRYPASE